VDLWGLEPGGHHVTSVVIHAANSALLFVTLERLFRARWRSAFVAALFALHPLRAESVAWVAERKDVLSAFFAILTILAYVRYAESPRARRMIPVVAAFTLAVLSKPMVVTIPFVLLLLDAWPLGRLRRPLEARLFVEKLPLFALSAATSLMTLRAGGPAAPVPIGARLVTAIVTYATFLSRIVLPWRLSIFHPHPLFGGTPYSTVRVTVSALVIVALAAIAVACARRRPYVTVGLAWYFGMLVPVVGFVQSGMGALGNRFTYLPVVGVLIAVTWLLGDALDRWRVRPAVAAAGASVLVAAYAAATFVEVGYFHDTKTVFTRAIASTGDNWVAEHYVGASALEEGDAPEAVLHFQRADRLNPESLVVLPDLAHALQAAGHPEEAIATNERVLRIDPGNAPAQNAICASLASLHRGPEAIRCLERTIELDPSAPIPYANLAALYRSMGNPAAAEDAQRKAQQALARLRPAQPL